MFAFSANVRASTAPTSVEGKKFILSDSDGVRSYLTTQLILDAGDYWDFKHENGDWEKGSFQWNTSGSLGTLKAGLPSSQDAYFELAYTFQSSDSGTFSYIKYELNDAGIFEIDEERDGTFQMSDYSTSDLPPFDTYFSDDFSSATTSQNYWYDNVETTWYGLQFEVNDGRLELIGTGTDFNELEFKATSKSLVTLRRDWIIQGDAFSNLNLPWGSWEANIGFKIEASHVDMEFYLGLGQGGTVAHLEYADSFGTDHDLYSRQFNEDLKQGTYRIRNDSDTKTLYAEYLINGNWNLIMSLNWETGAVNGMIGRYEGSSYQHSKWISMESKYGQPVIEFMIPSEYGTVKALSANQLGFNNFSVTSDEDSLPKAFEDLSGEVSRVNALIAQSTSDPEANLLRGLYALLEFVELDQSSDNSLKDFAVSLGVEESIRNFVLSDVSTLENYNFDLSDSFQAEELAELFEYSLIPALESADAYFSKIGSNQTITLSSEITGSDESITVDSADVYVLRSIVNILGGLASLQAAFDWDLNAGQTEALDNDPSIEVTAERIRDLNTNFGGIRSASLLTKSKNFLKTAVETYALASPLLRASSRLGTEERLFSLGSEDLNEESDFKGDLDELYLALHSNHNLREDGSTTDTLSLSNFFAGQVDIPTLLPELVGDQFETDQVSDPTLGGLFPNWDQARISALMLDAELSIPQPKGWMWFDSYPWVYSNEENSWIYLMPYDSKLMYYSVKRNAWLEMSASGNE
ncbi:MAG TPA: hypothetical protein DDY76_03425 [Opitutae bacterium]|nr:hypothetical protein [Opitutae bacterium]